MLQWLTQNFDRNDSISKECYQSVENMLHDYAERNNVSVENAASSLLKALDNEVRKALRDEPCIDDNPQAQFLLKLKTVAQAVGEEARLAAKLEHHPSFRGLNRDDVWKLVVPQREEIGSKLTAEENECGSLAGSFRGFSRLLESQGKPITVDWLIDLHHESTRDSYKTRFPTSEPDMFFPQGLRHEGTNLELRAGKELSKNGKLELQSKKEFTTTKGGNVELQFEPKTNYELRLQAGNILARYETDIRAAGNDPDKKLKAVARATQDLYRSHLFADGNTRTTVMMMMNRLLLDAGLSPALLDEPRVAGGHSLQEFIQKIKEGQERFQALRGNEVQ